MRFVIYGAGAIGGTIAARLHESGHEVAVIARGDHLRAIRERGLLFRTPEGAQRLSIPAVVHPGEVEWTGREVVFLAMKTQDTEAALRELEAAAGCRVPVVCAQNGVENERLAARRFATVIAMLVALPATFLVPGEVIASGAPLSGCLHAGLYPRGSDALVEEVCAALSASKFHALPSPDVMALKYRKLLLNLGNALDVLTGRSSWGAGGRVGALLARLREEGEACYRAAGIPYVSAEEYAERVQRHYRAVPVDGEPRSGSSTLQSVLRGHRTIEVDYLNGEIVLLGRLYGVPTPVNAAVRELAVRAASAGEVAGYTIDDLEALIETGRG
ncbi:ketopantoate reductase family protein [Tepidiforma sp.]|uniref:ketopantoate reductase family protein n=1 Tax=Tepidiforma sp. TaxID=2682230 RepID=UPI002ADE7C73|nr:2-dehydropantoate 2-reductase N-terminal domain-containing protein [Tepidiforma sp.]